MGGQISSSGSGENFNTTASISNSSRNSFNNNNNNCCIINSPSLSSIGSSGRKSRHWRTPPSSNSASPPINNNNNSSSSSFPFSSSTNSSFSSSSNGYNNTPFLIKQQLIRHTSLSTTNTGLKGRQKNNNSSHSNNNQWKVIPSPFIDNYNFNVGCSFIGPKEDTHCLLSQQSGMPGVYKNRHGSTYSKSSIGSTIKSINGGPSTFVSRWGGFTRALPGGFKGNNNKERHLMAKSLIKETTQSQRKRHLPSSKNRREKIEEKEDKNNIYVNLPNNNEENVYNEFANLSISNYSSNNIENVNGSLYQPSKDQREEEYDKDIVQYRRKKILENNNLNSKDFSLKSSLKRSGSRLFNGLIRGGYIRSLIGEDEYEEQVVRNGWEKGKEDENQQYNDNLQQTEFLDNNNNKTTNDLPKQQKLTISTSALRASLRQAKKKMMPKCSSVTTKPRINGNVEVYLNKKGDGELVSSMLLAMATCPPAETTSKRPFSAPTDNYTNTSIKTQKTKDLWFSADWSEENQKNKILDNLSPLKSNKRKVIQANSGELIKAIGYFICQHSCWPGIIEQFEPGHLGTWLRSVDRALILQGWQDVAFINPANLVFLFMLIRDAFLQGESKYLTSLEELHSFVLMCLYVSYSYMGNEISYPLKPFITENADRSLFWSKCIRLIKIHSNQMLRINASSTLFLEVFTELKTYCLPRQLNRNNDWLNNE